MSGRDLDIVRAGLNDRVLEVCQALFPQGRRQGSRFVCSHPCDTARQSPKLMVMLTGRIGGWTDFRSGDKGDLLKLVALARGTDIKGALAWGRDFLGLQKMSRAEFARMRDVSAQKRMEAEAAEADSRRRKIAQARALFQGADDFPASRLHAEAYLAARGVPLNQVARFARLNFRANTETEYWTKAAWKHEGRRRLKASPGPGYPALHAAMRQANGSPTACHVTFLDPVRPAKAAEKPPKLIKGVAGGAIIEVQFGPDGLPFWQSADARDVILAEGIETALSLAIAVPEARVWACGSLSGFATAPVHLPCVGRVFVGRDNNDGNDQAQRAFDIALAALEAAGKPITVMASHLGDDFNDLTTGAE